MIADAGAMADQYGGKAHLCAALEVPYTSLAAPTAAAIAANFAQFTTKFWGPNFPAMCFYDSECRCPYFARSLSFCRYVLIPKEHAL
jgi:hypothetical protein